MPLGMSGTAFLIEIFVRSQNFTESNDRIPENSSLRMENWISWIIALEKKTNWWCIHFALHLIFLLHPTALHENIILQLRSFSLEDDINALSH